MQDQSGELRFVVRSADNGEPVIGAHIRIFDPETEEELDVSVTNVDGFSAFREIPAQQVGYRVSYLGFEDHVEYISVPANQIRVIRVDLQPNVSELGEVVVEAQNEYESGNAGLERISAQDLSRIPTAGLSGDLASYLQVVPGVVSTGDTGGDLYVRGGLPSQNIVLMDDIPLVKPFHISNIYSAFPQEVVNNVDVYAGGFGAEYMNATSAVLDVSLRPGNLVRGQGSVTASPFVTGISAEGPLKKNVSSILFSARVSTMEEGTRRLSRRTQNVNFYDIIGRYTLNTESFNCSFTGILTSDEGVINPVRDLELGWTNNGLGLRCFGFDGGLNNTFEFSLGYSGFENYERDRFGNESSSSLNQVWLSLGTNFRLFDLEWDYGARTTVQLYETVLDDRFSAIETFDDGLPIVQTYLSTTLRPIDGLTVKPSLGSMGAVNGGPTLEPRVRMAYRPPTMKNSEFSFAAGRYFQLADGIQDQRNTGNVFVIWRPSANDNPLQRAWHFMGGIRQRLGKYLVVNAEAYAKLYQNLIVAKWTPQAQISTETGLADGEAIGAELKLSYDRGPFFGLLTYSLSRVQYDASRDDLGAWINGQIFTYNPAHDQRHKFNAVAVYDFGFASANVRWEFGSGLPYTQVFGFDLYVPVPILLPEQNPGIARTLYDRAYSDRLPTYHRLDLSIQKQITVAGRWNVSTEIGAYNIYDRNNIFVIDVNELSRIDQIAFAPYISFRTSID